MEAVSLPVVYALLRYPFLLTAVRRNLGREKVEETGVFTIVRFAYGSKFWAECFVLGNSESRTVTSEFSPTTASFYITPKQVCTYLGAGVCRFNS